MKGHMSFRLAMTLLMSMALVLSSVSTAAAKTWTFQSLPPQPPPNDNFANPAVISAPSFSETVDITYAGLEDGELQGYCDHSPQTIWYSFAPAADTAVRVSLAGSSITNNVLNIYEPYGPGISDLNHLSCAMWSNPMTLFARAGKTYYFQAGCMGWDTCSGNLQFNLEQIQPPANDDWANARVIPVLGFEDGLDASGATREASEPTPSCAQNYTPGGTIWYAFTPQETRSISANAYTPNSPVIAIYTGNPLASLSEVSCASFWNTLTFHATAGTTYYFQVADLFVPGGWMSVNVRFTPPPEANFYFDPSDPSVFDDVYFNDTSWDPGGAGIQSQAWDLGDGTMAAGCCPTHRYAKDGDYSVKLTITTNDGRTASTSQVVHVKTHDVAITKLTAPQSASAGQTRQIAVGINSKRYVEKVRVELFKSVPGGYQSVGWLEQQVPVRPSNRTTTFSFSYTFTKDDAALGKVTFKAVATIVDARDALPADNEAISSPTKVNK